MQNDRTGGPHPLAEAGHWYDAIALLSEQIEANPQDPNPRAQRAALLQQVGLQQIADYDMNPRGN
jgi:regulator of sirC expression with transglutaminase-like and TPR domain